MTTRSIRTRLGRGLAVVIAGSIVGVTGAMVAADDRPSRSTNDRADLEAIAEWARANGYSGLSPASLSKVDFDRRARAEMAAEYQALAELAREEGLTGLSPAWLEPIATDAPDQEVTP